MDYVKNIFGKLGRRNEESKEFVRSKKPYYLVSMPFYKRYPRVFILVGGVSSFLILFSAPIYHGLFSKPEDFMPDELLWMKEKIRGKTHLETFKEYTKGLHEEREEKRAEKKRLAELKLKESQ